jgi:lysozyme
MKYLLGGDYSYYDPLLSWMDHSWKYAFIKATEGIVDDPDFRLQWEAAEGYVYRGAYHFFRPWVPWDKAADKFIGLLEERGKGELPPVLDLESMGTASGEIRHSALEWLRRVHRELAVRPIVYTSPGFANTIELWREPEFSRYPLWQATYPYDEIKSTWSEQQRREKIHEVLQGRYEPPFPTPARPWEKATFWQFTGKCPPEYVPGYPLGGKMAVDVNLFSGTLDDLTRLFNLPILQGGTMSTKPITWTATLLPGQAANLRPGPGIASGFKETLRNPTSQPIIIRGTGSKTQNPQDRYYWAEIVMFGSVSKTGFIAFTTSIGDVRWLDIPTPPPVPTTKKAIRSETHYDDGSKDVFFPSSS